MFSVNKMIAQDVREQNLKLYRAIKKIFSLPEGQLVLKTLEKQCGIHECSPYQAYSETLYYINNKDFPYKVDPYYVMYKTGQTDMFLFIKKFLDMSEEDIKERNDIFAADIGNGKTSNGELV